MMGKICTNCGVELKPGVKFCTNCGEQVKTFLNLGDGLHKLFHDSRADKIAILKELFFTFQGRLNRKAYLYRCFVVSFVNLIRSIIFNFAMNESVMGTVDYILFALAVICNVIACAASITIVARRLHDLDMSGWWMVLSLIPVVNIGFGCYVLFSKGTTGPNRFGDDPLQQA